VAPATAELGVGFVPYSPLGRGFLTGTIRSAADLSSPSDVRTPCLGFADGALEANLAVVDVVRSVAEEQRARPAQVALAWLRYRAEASVWPRYDSRHPPGVTGRGEPWLVVGHPDPASSLPWTRRARGRREPRR